MTTQKLVVTPGIIATMLFFIVLIPLLPLLISGRWGWWEAWTYALASIMGFAISRMLAARRNPDILAERARFMRHENTQPWDNRLAPLLGIGAALALIVIGLDDLFRWSPAFSMPIKVIALILTLVGYTIASYALIENRFFSGTVRLQPERGQHVISGGPYAWVRHPGYAGSLVTYLATPFFLDSSWALLPTILLCLVLVVRTAKEDSFLQESLDGYREYAKRVRYRLVPGVW